MHLCCRVEISAGVALKHALLLTDCCQSTPEIKVEFRIREASAVLCGLGWDYV